MKILVGHEESQAVTKALRAMGHEAYSCDLLDCSGGHPEWHLKMDVFQAIALDGWWAGIFFPTCTYLCSSGLHWNKRRPGRQELTDAAVEHVQRLWNCGIPSISIENPIGCLSTRFAPPLSDNSAVDVWTPGEQGYLSLAQKPAATQAYQHSPAAIVRALGEPNSQRSEPPRPQRGSRKDSEQDVCRHRAGDGYAVVSDTTGGAIKWKTRR